MQQAISSIRNLQIKKRFIPPAVLLGIGFGLFASGYWLSDTLPAGSRLLLIFTALAGGAGALVYYVLSGWAAERFSSLSTGQRLVFGACSLLAGILLLLGGTSQWLTPARYIRFLLPSHQLRITVQAASRSAGHLVITWFNTSLGDVSYETIGQRGWSRKGEQLVLVNPDDNSLTWTGRTGEAVQILFQGTNPSDRLVFSWDGREEISIPTSGKFNYVHNLEVPWYASSGFVLGLGVLVAWSLSFCLMLLLWQRRERLSESVQNAMQPSEGGLVRKDAALVLGTILLALLLRLPNLGTLFPAVDEYYHLIAARQIIDGAALASVYQRGLWVVTVPVSLFLRAFGYEFWAARLPGALFNALAILPLYLLTSKINRPVAVLSSVLYATSPWIVTFGRIAREYAFYPFYFYWIIFGMVCFLQGVPQDFVLARQWRDLLRRGMILVALGLVLPPLFALYGDRLSTFRTILIAYPIFGLFLLGRFKLRERLNWPVLAVLGGSILALGYAWYERQAGKLLVYPQFNPLPVEYFLPNPQQQWYFDRLGIVVVAGLLLLAASGYLIRRTNFVPVFIFVLYASYLGIFAFFAKTFFHTRHLSTTELWYIVVVALGLYLIFKVVETFLSWKGRTANVLLVAVLGLSVINVQQVFVPISSTDPDNPISQDYLHDLTKVHAFMLTHAQPHDVLISTVYGLYSSWQEQPRFETQVRITSQTPSADVFSIINQYESGWIVIDQIRLGLSALGPRDFATHRDIQFIGVFDDQYVWHWQHTSGSYGNTVASGKGQ